jgi:hypothetical protein
MKNYTRIWNKWTLAITLALAVATVGFLGTSGARPPGPTPTRGIPGVLDAIMKLGALLSDNAESLNARIDKLEAQNEALNAEIQDLVIKLRVDCGAPPDLVAEITTCGETAIVRNEGGSTAGASTTLVTVNGASMEIPTPKLDPGEEFPVDLTCAFTPDCNISVEADKPDAVNESDETNNDDSCSIIG